MNETLAGAPLLLREAGVGPEARVVHADALTAARALADASERPTLVYIDPPFAAERDFFARLPDGSETLAYRDKWDSLGAYLAFMEAVLAALRDALSDEGSLLLHCDHRAAPYLAVLCDRLFGMGDRGSKKAAAGFRNELIWSYGLGGSSPRCYPKKHDTILWYSRGADWFFEPPRVPATSQRMRGQTKKAPDVLNVPTLNNMAKERCGYPTQKPLALLDLLVRAHAPEGALVADVFSGSGTTSVAAARQGRRAFAADIGADAVAATATRLREAGAPLAVYGGDDVVVAMERWG